MGLRANAAAALAIYQKELRWWRVIGDILKRDAEYGTTHTHTLTDSIRYSIEALQLESRESMAITSFIISI